MSKRKLDRTSEPSPELQAQLKAALARQAETALVKTETKLEMIPNTAAGKMVQAARGRTGKFLPKAEALTADTQKRLINAAYTSDPTTGTTLVERVIKKGLETAEKNESVHELGQITQLLEHVDVVSGQALVRQKLSKEETKTPITKVEMTITLNNGTEPIDWDKRVREQAKRNAEGPSWIKAESFETNP